MVNKQVSPLFPARGKQYFLRISAPDPVQYRLQWLQVGVEDKSPAFHEASSEREEEKNRSRPGERNPVFKGPLTLTRISVNKF